MRIRKATDADLERISDIYEAAREYMVRAGNAHQWRDGYPSDDIVREDIAAARLYVCEDENGGEILGVFCYFFGEEATYRRVCDGAWDGAPPYGVMHRVAVAKDAHGRGVADFCFDFCFSQCTDLRIDTHRDNIPMQRVLARCGFERRGTIYLENGDERTAFQKTQK